MVVDNVILNVDSAADYDGPTTVVNTGVLQMDTGGSVMTTSLTVGAADAGAGADFGTVNHGVGMISISGDASIGPASGVATSNYNLSGGTLTFNDTDASTQAPISPESTLAIGPNGAFNFSSGMLENVTNINVDPSVGSFTVGDMSGDIARFVIGNDGVSDPDNAVRARTNIWENSGSLAPINFTLNSDGELVIDIFGPGAHGGGGENSQSSAVNPLDPNLDSDILYVTGDATLAGMLEINLNSYDPTPFHWYDVLLAEGDIDIEDSFQLTDGLFYRVFDFPTANGIGQLLQVAVPEPASIAIWALISLVMGGYGYTCVRRRK
jgi:hypothetical protein